MPSVAFKILTEKDKKLASERIVCNLVSFQKTFKNCTVLIVGQLTDRFWIEIQCSMPPGRLHFVFMDSDQEGVSVIQTYVAIMKKNMSKKKIQEDFFTQVSNIGSANSSYS